MRLESEFSTLPEAGTAFSGEALQEILHETLARGCSVRMRTRGFSMFPCIMDNDIVTVSPLNGCLSYVGLAVAFIHPSKNKLVMHRIIHQDRNTVLIKGDSLFGKDGFIPLKNTVGMVTKVERNDRNVNFGVRDRSSLALFLNRTNIFTVLYKIGMCLPQGLRQAIKTTLFG